MHLPSRRSPLRLAVVATGLVVIGGIVSAMAGEAGFLISQKGRAFQPSEIAIKRGETLHVFNDDADLLHHAYVDSDTFTFDSGDQEPGSKTDILFSVAGDFKVLCGIHPKMRLAVHVE